jgi:SAM-dependent methyltransferase
MKKKSIHFLKIGIFFLFICSVQSASGQQDDEQVWQKFLQWLPSAPPSDNPGPVFGRYRQRLLDTGIAVSEVDKQLEAIKIMLRTRTDGWRVMFNNIYTHDTPGFNVQPNATLVTAVEKVKPGKALDVGMGQGRNSIFLALKGWEVTGFDISDKGLDVAQKNADKAGVKIKTILKSNEDFEFGTDIWSLIVITYEPVPLTEAKYINRISQSLRSGGIIVIESFASDFSSQNRKPVDIDPVQLKKAFADFNIIRFEDKLDIPDWSKEKSRLVRMVAQKK